MVGDINEDGNIDLTDAIIALKVVVGTDTQADEDTRIRSDYAEADVSGDDKIGTEEAISILRYISESAG